MNFDIEQHTETHNTKLLSLLKAEPSYERSRLSLSYYRGALAVVHRPPYIHLQQERRVRTAPPVSVRVRVSVSFSVTVLCLQLWRCI